MKNAKKGFKFSVLFIFLNLLTACGDTPPNYGSCPVPTAQLVADTDVATFVAEAKGETLSLVLKLNADSLSPLDLKQALVQSHAASAKELGKFKLSSLAEDFVSLEIPKASPALSVLQEMIEAGEIQYAEPDYETFSIEPSKVDDPDLDKQWAHKKMHTFEAWETTRGDQNLIIAVIDSGVDYTHQDLKANMWHNPAEVKNGIDDDGNGYVDDIIGYDFANKDADPMADDERSYHGTHVAGTIAATMENHAGGAGVAPKVKIMALKYLNAKGSGKSSDAIMAIDYAVKMGAKVINNSWGSLSYSKSLEETIARARDKGVLFVAAAGNGDFKGNGIDLDRTPFYPAGYALDNVISVAATDSNDKLTKFSNYGAHNVHVAAPGLNIYSTRNGNTYANLSGTSMATPAVAGVLGLILSANPKLNYYQAKMVLFHSADRLSSLSGKMTTGARVNAAKAVSMSRDPEVEKQLLSSCLASQ